MDLVQSVCLQSPTYLQANWFSYSHVAYLVGLRVRHEFFRQSLDWRASTAKLNLVHFERAYLCLCFIAFMYTE